MVIMRNRKFLEQRVKGVKKENSSLKFQHHSITGKSRVSSAGNICQLLPNEGELFFQ